MVEALFGGVALALAGLSAVSGAVIPPWQIATSLGLLGVSGFITLMLGSKLFRLGMLLYGKTPNLPEIMRILRQP